MASRACRITSSQFSDERNSFFSSLRDPQPPLLASMLRMGTKYNIEHLRRDAICILSKMFPTYLHFWDILCAGSNVHFPFDRKPDWWNLVKDFDLDYFMPSILFRLWMSASGRASPYDRAMWRLNGWTQDQVDAAHDELSHYFDTALHAWHTRPSSCRQARACYGHKEEIYRLMCNDSTRFQTPERLFTVHTFDTLGFRLCFSCREDARVELTQARQDLWERLPRYFGYPAWDVLRKRLDEGLRILSYFFWASLTCAKRQNLVLFPTKPINEMAHGKAFARWRWKAGVQSCIMKSLK